MLGQVPPQGSAWPPMLDLSAGLRSCFLRDNECARVRDFGVRHGGMRDGGYRSDKPRARRYGGMRASHRNRLRDGKLPVHEWRTAPGRGRPRCRKRRHPHRGGSTSPRIADGPLAPSLACALGAARPRQNWDIESLHHFVPCRKTSTTVAP